MNDTPRILVVEDEAIVAADIEQQLRSFGYEVVGLASRGERALELAGELLPDLILMDITIKGDIDGIETAKRIRTLAEIPVVFLTAHSDGPTLERAREAEPSGYLVKPYGESDLQATVKMALTRFDVERRLRETQRELAESNEMLEWFVRALSHDVRAPLRQISSLVTFMLADHPDLPEDAREQAAKIQERADRLHSLADRLMTLARVGHEPLKHEQVDMQASVAAVVEDLDSGSVAFEVGELAAITGDVVLLGQVWANLVGNAAKFSATSEAPRVRISSREDGGYVEYSVADNGPGFDDEQAARVFQPFERLGSEEAGHGIGLTLVSRIVAAHGGTVRATGAPGEGATFTFRLPR